MHVTSQTYLKTFVCENKIITYKSLNALYFLIDLCLL
jgi:hypothetical protein